MPQLDIIESSKTEFFGTKIPNRNNQNVVISTVKSTHIDYFNEKESDSGSDNGSISYVPPKNTTDIAGVEIFGPNITDREIIREIEFPPTIDSDEEESDSDSDDGKIFLVDDKSIELIGCKNNFTDATMNFVKKPLKQTMSTASDTSTNYNLNSDNRNSWIGSSSSSESECEDDSKDIEKKENEREDEITKGLENLRLVENKNNVKNSELKIINTLDNVDDLSLQTSKMNINFSNNDEKNFIGKEGKLSKNLPVKNYHTSQNDEEDSNESEDSDSSDEQTDSESENDDWITRGKWSKKVSTESIPNSKNIERIPYGKSKPTIGQKSVEKWNEINISGFGTGFGKNDEEDSNESEDSDSSDEQTDSESENDDWITRGKWSKKVSTESIPNSKNIERIPYGKSKPTIGQKSVEKWNEINISGFGTGFGKMTTNQTTMNLLSNSWHYSGTGECQNTDNYGDLQMSVKNDQRYTVNQDLIPYPIPYSSPTMSEYTQVQSIEPASDSSPLSYHDSPQSSEGYYTGDCEENFPHSSRDSHQHYATSTNVQSANNALDNINNRGNFKNFENPNSISNMHKNMVPKHQPDFQCQNTELILDEIINNVMNPHLVMKSLAQPNLPPNNVSQTNSVNISKNQNDSEQTKIIEDIIDLQEERLDSQMNFNRLNNMVSSNKNMFSQTQSSFYISKSPEVNQLNSDNLMAKRIPPTSRATHNQGKNNPTILSIKGSSDTRGQVTVKASDDHAESIQQIKLDLESGSDLGNNYEELEQTFNDIQEPPIADNYDVDKQNYNVKLDIVELDRVYPCNKLVQETFENPKESNILIPSPVYERSQSVPDKKLEKKQIWSVLDLPDTNACKRLKEMLKVDMVERYALKFLRCPKEEFEAVGEKGDTLLTTILSNPKILKNELNCLVPMVGKMLRNSKSLMIKNNQGHDALYLAAINCPELPYVTGYLAATIEKFHKIYDLKFNVYNRNNDTLMHVVAAQGDSHRFVMKELLALRKERGCSFFDPSARNSDGKTPLDLAIEANRNIPSKQSNQIVQLLKEHGADFGITDKKGSTAFHCNIIHYLPKTFESISDMKRNKNNSNG